MNKAAIIIDPEMPAGLLANADLGIVGPPEKINSLTGNLPMLR